MGRGAGRPRSEETRLAILRATSELLVERGYDQMTMNAVAERAGAGKQTIYRQWGSKARLVADAVFAGVLPLSADPIPDRGTLHADLSDWLEGIVTLTSSPVNRSIVRALASASTDGEARSDTFEAVVTNPVNALLGARLAAARRAGEIREDVDDDLVIDVIVGTLTQTSIGRTRLDRARIERLVDTLLRGIGASRDRGGV
jgi:AcrR family transcriptional regulator